MRAVYYILIKLLCLLAAVLPVYSQSPKNIFADNSFGVKGGYPLLFGYYADELISSGSVEIFYIPFAGERFFMETGLSFSAYALESSPDSFLYRTGLYVSPSMMMFKHNSFAFYGGLSLGAEYVYLKAKMTGVTISTFKPAGGINTGILYYFGRGFSSRLGVEYRNISLSDKYFHTLNFFAGVSYSPESGRLSSGEYSRRETEQLRSAEEEYAMGIEKYKLRDSKQARAHFRKTLEIRPDHPLAAGYLNELNRIESEKERALALARSDRNIEAVIILEKIAPRSIEAESELIRIRDILRNRVGPLTKDGVAAYDAGDYQKCVELMGLALLIDPGNSTARIYHARAQKRIKALEKLK